MSEIPPSDNPLLNQSAPQRPGYYSPPTFPAALPAASAASGPVPPAVPVPTPAPVAASAAPSPSSPAVPISPPPARPADYRPKPKKNDNTVTGAIDTIEAVLIALILALTFRAFVVEAFVIPTGSMAPTLLGAHFNVVCPKCGYAFTESVDLSTQLNRSGYLGPLTDENNKQIRGDLVNSMAQPAPPVRLCPNCRYAIADRDLPQLSQPPLPIHDSKDGRSSHYYPWTNNGDRILVLKYLYNIVEPQRWDVIVFKEPMHAVDNYIKRLVGLPGETLLVVGGDLFVAPASADASPSTMTVARKPQHVQDAVWQLVYDNDFFPIDSGKERGDQPAFLPLWVGQGATGDQWQTNSAQIRYAAEAPGQVAFQPPADSTYFYNIRGYNNDAFESIRNYHDVITDMHLQAAWTPASAGAAAIDVTIGPPSNQYKVQWNASGALQLEHLNPRTRQFDLVPDAHIEAGVSAPHPGQAYNIAMNNVDHAIQFFIDGRQVLNYESVWTVSDAEKFAGAQSTNPELPVIAVNVAGACTLGHVKLMRDVYYTQVLLYRGDPLSPERMSTPPLHQAVNGVPVHLGPDEFFVMGDNSTASFDSRGWYRSDDENEGIVSSLDDLPVGRDHHYGIVPRRFLLGKAFFVYWPAGYRPLGGNLGGADVPLVPNVGEMRFIR